MWNNITETFVTIALAVVGLATVSVLVSKNAATSSDIQAVSSGLANNIAVAQSPVTGNHVSINTSYPSSTFSMGFGS